MVSFMTFLDHSLIPELQNVQCPPSKFYMALHASGHHIRALPRASMAPFPYLSLLQAYILAVVLPPSRPLPHSFPLSVAG